eukprot:scaffold3927_cov152-Skeletonema_menzelii.AAC.4
MKLKSKAVDNFDNVTCNAVVRRAALDPDRYIFGAKHQGQGFTYAPCRCRKAREALRLETEELVASIL